MTNTTWVKITAILAAISTLVTLISARSLRNGIEQGFALQFGGVQNYKLAKQLYSNPTVVDQQKKSLEQAIDSVNKQGTTQSPSNQDQNTQQPTDTTSSVKVDASGTFTPEQLANVKKDAYIVGNKDAQISIVEYTDPECPYCIVQHQNGTLKDIVQAYNGSVNTITKVVQGVNHPGTQYKSYAILCAGKLGGAEAYQGMYDKIYGNSKPDAVVPTASIAGYATELKLDASKFEACITNSEMKAVYDASWSEFRGLIAQPGTPGNLILNNKTGEWKLIMGAYPLNDFKSVIDGMLAKK